MDKFQTQFINCETLFLVYAIEFFRSLPDDDTQVATVGNGHVATLVYSDTVYINGLYNGVRGESHRAR